MKEQTAKFYNWALEKASSSKAPYWVALLFVLELFLFIPLDAVLMFFCLQDRRKTILYVVIAALASTLSAALGYLVGHFLWDLVGPFIVPTLISGASFERISAHLQEYENWGVFLAALIPFPLKAVTLVAGVFHLKFAEFISFIFLARLLRFSLIGAAMILFGEKVKSFVDRHFQKIFMAIGAKTALIFLMVWAFAR